jgi:hypothetical protein
MPLSGSLQTMSAGDLIQWASLARKTGALTVTHGGVQKKVYFREGRLISSASTDPRDYLGQFLMSYGFINEDELRKAMQVQNESGMLLGKILVTIGVISEEDLRRLLRLKAEEEIYDIFLWNEGEFHFSDDEIPKMQMVPLNVDVTGMIMEGSRRKDEWAVINEVIPERSHIPVMEKPVDDLNLPPEKLRIVQMINGRRSMEEVGLESRAVKFLVAKTIYELFRSGHVKVVEPTSRVETVKSRDLPSPEEEVNSLLSQAEAALSERVFERAIRFLRAAQEVEPDSPRVKSAVTGAENAIRSQLQQEGFTAKKVPRVVKSIDEITDMNFSPNEGFVLSRIDGNWDLGSIIKVSPLREIDGLLIFRQLRERGVIDLE